MTGRASDEAQSGFRVAQMLRDTRPPTWIATLPKPPSSFGTTGRPKGVQTTGKVSKRDLQARYS